jgi:hypothetical protein
MERQEPDVEVAAGVRREDGRAVDDDGERMLRAHTTSDTSPARIRC